MAQVAGTFATYHAVGNREDLTDFIYDISPTETPFLTMAKRAKAKATFHEWQTDSLTAAAANRQIEGDDASYSTAAATTRLGNYCQISRKTVLVSGTQDVVDKAGRKRELAYQIAKRAKEIKRDMEFALVRNQASSAGGNATARSLASVESWLATNKTSKGTGTAQTTPGFSSGTVVAPTDSTAAGSFTETDLKAIISSCWTEGGDPAVVMVGPNAKKKISGFAGIGTQFRDVGGKTAGSNRIVGAADIYISDFGEHRIVPNRFSRDQTVLCLDMDYWAVAYLREFQQEELAKTGDAEKRMMLAEYTLESRNQAASGKIADVDGTL